MSNENFNLDHISPALRPHAVRVDSLKADPANVRLHSSRNIDAIKRSLVAYGQQTPIVTDNSGTVRKGNGTLQAARALGWTHVAAIASNLPDAALTAYAVADNRSGDPEIGSVFDQQALADALEALNRSSDFDPLTVGFTPDELSALIHQQNDLPADASGRLLDEAIVLTVKTVTCPHCAKEFPL